MERIKVSIITVCYNSEKTIEKTILSVLNQTYKNIEYIIIDGKSTDNTLSIVNKYKKKFGNRMKVISEKDNGIYDAMNKGIRNSTGSLIGIINSDDSYELTAVEKIVNKMENYKYQIIYGSMKMYKNDKLFKIIFNSHENLFEEMINHPTCFISKDIYIDFGMYNTDYKSCSDYEFMIKAYNNSSIHFIPIYDVIASFNYGGMSQKINAHIETIKMLYKNGIITRSRFIKKIVVLYIKKYIFRYK